MINEADLRQMSAAERRRLARMLAAIDYPHPLLDLNLSRRWKLGALFAAIAAIILAGWIIVLVLTLHKEATATHWQLAWVGFDIFELIGFALTGWALWRGRQIAIACLLVTATLLFADAWFDVILDLRTSDMWLSIWSAVIVELPLAFLMFNAARRLIRLSALAAVSADGEITSLPSLWKLPLAGLNVVGRGKTDSGRGAGCQDAGREQAGHSAGRDGLGAWRGEAPWPVRAEIQRSPVWQSPRVRT